MNNRLVEANFKKDPVIAGEVLNMAMQLRDTWEQVVKKAREESQNQNQVAGNVK